MELQQYMFDTGVSASALLLTRSVNVQHPMFVLRANTYACSYNAWKATYVNDRLYLHEVLYT